MEFNPHNNIVKLCIQGMGMEDTGKADEARRLFLEAWDEATNDFEKYIAAYYVARHQDSVADSLKWLETALELARKVDSVAATSAFPGLHKKIAECYEELGDAENARRNFELAESSRTEPTDEGPFYHGTRADLGVGDLLNPGGASNYKSDLVMNHIYFTAMANGAGLAAALANGEGHERVYIVEPTGPFENDPNVTNKKFPGNPTRSYRSTAPLKIVGELDDWVRQTPEQVREWREKLAKSKGEIIN
jgi:tetratricopeptide (TPR) repeat protein